MEEKETGETSSKVYWYIGGGVIFLIIVALLMYFLYFRYRSTTTSSTSSTTTSSLDPCDSQEIMAAITDYIKSDLKAGEDIRHSGCEVTPNTKKLEVGDTKVAYIGYSIIKDNKYTGDGGFYVYYNIVNNKLSVIKLVPSNEITINTLSIACSDNKKKTEMVNNININFNKNINLHAVSDIKKERISKNHNFTQTFNQNNDNICVVKYDLGFRDSANKFTESLQSSFTYKYNKAIQDWVIDKEDHEASKKK
jgi:hypothetical protein